MALEWLGSLVGGIGALSNLGLGIAQYNQDKEINERNYALAAKNAQRNYELQADTNLWERQQQQELYRRQDLAMAREDSAVQRRVADMRAAGLNPVLAAGSAATTMAPSAPIRLTTPSIDTPQKSSASMSGMRGSIDSLISIMRQVQDIATTAEQQKLIALQAKGQQSKNIGQDIDNARAEHDLRIFTDLGVASNSTGIARDIANAIGVIKSPGGIVGNALQGIIKKQQEKEFMYREKAKERANLPLKQKVDELSPALKFLLRNNPNYKRIIEKTK